MSFNNINLAASMGYNGYLKFSQQSLLYSHSVTLPEMKKKNAKSNHINFTGGKKQCFTKKELASKTLRPRVAKSFLLQSF